MAVGPGRRNSMLCHAFHIAVTLSVLSALVVVALGVWLLRKGFRRVGREPHCRKCEYSLVGLQSDRCPECGTAMKEALVYGSLARSKWKLGLGIFLLGFAPWFGFALVRPVERQVESFDWYSYKPTSWLMEDLRTGSGKSAPQSANRGEPWIGHGWPGEGIDLARCALDVLRERDSRHKLSRQTRNEIFDLGVAAEAHRSHPSTSEYHLLDYASERCLSGDVTTEQLDRFVKPGLVPLVRVRAKVLVNHDVPLNIVLPELWEHWRVEGKCNGVMIDGVTIDEPESHLSYLKHSTHLSLPPQRLGAHTVTIDR